MIYVLLPVHNRRDTTVAFARMLAAQTVDRFHVVLLDDGSSDGTAQAVSGILPDRITVLYGTGDWWWGGSLHRGFQWLRESNVKDDDIVFICNDDVDLPPDFIENGVQLLKENADALVVAKSRVNGSDALIETCYSIDFARCSVTLALPDQRPMCAPTRGLFVTWGAAKRVGDFHPRLIPHYLADLEWTLRANRRGLQIVRDDRLWLTQYPEKTGFHGLQALTLRQRVRRVFSKKYAVNPLHWTAFVLLGFPVRYWPPALARVALWTAGAIVGRAPRAG